MKGSWLGGGTERKREERKEKRAEMASVDDGVCAVCCDALNKSTRKVVDCGKCGFAACRRCCASYLLETALDPHCMSCRTPWDVAYLTANFTQTFVGKDLKAHRETVLFDRERALLPETQAECELYKAKVKHENKATELRRKLKAADAEASAARARVYFAADASVDDTIRQLEAKKNTVIEVLSMKADIQFHKDAAAIYDQAITGHRRGSPPRANLFVRACPAEGCRGFLNGGSWKCGLCGVKVCAQCHEIKAAPTAEAEEGATEPHECKPENVATAKLIAKDSKPCPSCASLIFRVSGCSQMFCTSCHTPFDWKTGDRITGFIHNPELADLAARLGRTPAQLLGVRERRLGQAAAGDCDAEPVPYNTVFHYMGVIRNCGVAPAAVQNMHQLYLAYGHNRDVIMPRFRTGGPDSNKDIRIQYLLGGLDDNQFKRRLQQREKANNKKRDISAVLEVYFRVMREIINKISQAHGQPLSNEVRQMVEETAAYAEEIRNQTNDMLRGVCERYKSGIWQVGNEWVLGTL